MRLLNVIAMVCACAAGGCASTTNSVPIRGTTWVLTPAEGEPPTMLLADAEKAAGFAGVNRWFADYQLSGSSEGKLRFGRIGMTLMAGPPPAMERETRFVSALQSVDAYRRVGPNLELLCRGEVLLTFGPATEGK